MSQQSGGVGVSRREWLSRMAALPTLASISRAAPTPRYRLGVMAGMYGSVPLDDAMTRIRKIGYRYISIARKHGDDIVYSPELPKAERTRMLRRIRDLGVEPFMSLGGFGGSDPQTPEGLQKYLQQLDLCADYEIPIMVGGGPWYYKKFPNIPKRDKDWQEEVTRFYALRGDGEGAASCGIGARHDCA